MCTSHHQPSNSGSHGASIILGTGIDIVQNGRLESWVESEQHLAKVFTTQELELYHDEFSVTQPLDQTLERQKKAAYVAARYAAKEAFYKALSAVLLELRMTRYTFSFLFCCQGIEVIKHEWGVPRMVVDWAFFEAKIDRKLPDLQVHTSLSHERDYAVASVVISQGTN